MHTVGSAEEARRAVASRVDVIVAQGWEAGGHVWGGVATLPLVPAVVDAVAPVPVGDAAGVSRWPRAAQQGDELSAGPAAARGDCARDAPDR